MKHIKLFEEMNLENAKKYPYLFNMFVDISYLDEEYYDVVNKKMVTDKYKDIKQPIVLKVAMGPNTRYVLFDISELPIDLKKLVSNNRNINDGLSIRNLELEAFYNFNDVYIDGKSYRTLLSSWITTQAVDKERLDEIFDHKDGKVNENMNIENVKKYPNLFNLFVDLSYLKEKYYDKVNRLMNIDKYSDIKIPYVIDGHFGKALYDLYDLPDVLKDFVKKNTTRSK